MASLQGKEILVIDDEKITRFLARKILESEGARVLEAESIERGLELAQSNVPHLIITDLNFPDSSGFDLLKDRLTSRQMKSIPTIVLSGQTDKESVMRALSLGADDYVLKPLRTLRLLQKVQKSLKTAGIYSFRFSPESRPSARISLAAEILKLNEAGFEIETSLKLAANHPIHVTAQILDTLDCTQTPTRSTSVMGQYVSDGRYINHVTLVGLGEQLAKAVRTRIKEWK